MQVHRLHGMELVPALFFKVQCPLQKFYAAFNEGTAQVLLFS